MNVRSSYHVVVLVAAGLLSIVAGCTAAGTKPRIRIATAKTLATPTTIEDAKAQAARNARTQRQQWTEKDFEAFERSVYKEPFAGGKYIVNGDTTISDRKQLREFFEEYIQKGQVSGLILHMVGGQAAMWDDTQKKQLTYCVSTDFGSTRYDDVVQAMANATGAWEQVADIDFIHVGSQDAACNAANSNVLFDVRPVNVNGQYLARAFFPNEPRAERNVLIDNSSFGLDPNAKLQLVGILRHELGHTLGFRHEHTRPESGTCFEDTDWTPITAYDSFSVMHYPQCNGGGDWSLTLTNEDENGAACVYGPAPGFQINTQICQLMNPPSGSVCTANVEYHDNQEVQRGSEIAYGPFSVSPGTVFKADMLGSTRNPGDPDLYVRFGQAPSRSGRLFDCRPYRSGADEHCSLNVPTGQTQAFVMVHGFSKGAYDIKFEFTSD